MRRISRKMALFTKVIKTQIVRIYFFFCGTQNVILTFTRDRLYDIPVEKNFKIRTGNIYFLSYFPHALSSYSLHNSSLPSFPSPKLTLKNQ